MSRPQPHVRFRIAGLRAALTGPVVAALFMTAARNEAPLRTPLPLPEWDR